MPAQKLYTFKDPQLDRQVEEIVHYMGRPHCPGLPIYADNTAALAGGLVAGQFYRTATGTLMVVY